MSDLEDKMRRADFWADEAVRELSEEDIEPDDIEDMEIEELRDYQAVEQYLRSIADLATEYTISQEVEEVDDTFSRLLQNYAGRGEYDEQRR